MKTGEIEIELRHLSKRELIKLVEEQQQRIDKAIEYIEGVNYNNKIASAYEDNNTTKCTKKDIIEQEIRHDNYILSILRGEDNE